jgi:membrane protease YdiL (CAAX protease family)
MKAVDRPTSGVRGFFDKGGFWRLLVFVVVYMTIYLGSGWVLKTVLPDFGRGDLLDNLSNVFAQLTFALIVGAIVLSLFTKYMGWNAELYGRQPIYRSGWMWLGPIIGLVPIVLRVLGIDWGSHAVTVVVLVLVTGQFIGFVEELLCRGIAVKMLRTGGHGELVVATLSSLVFGLLHATNLLSGAALLPTLAQVFYTFGFGVLMYLTMRVTGFLVAAMVLHGLTDPMGILANGAVSDVATGTSLNTLLSIGGQLTIPVGLVGVILLFFVRGKAGQTTRDSA